MAGPIFGAIADDLTGGLELAGMLVGQGARVAFVTAPGEVAALAAEADALDAVVVALKIRVVPAERAIADAVTAAGALMALGCRQLFYKYCATFDSTDRGNIGPVADRLAEMTGAEAVYFVPSFPEVGRTVYLNHLFVGTQLLSESPKRYDPLTPMTDPDIARVLARQSARPVGAVHYPAVRQGADAIRSATARAVAEGARHLVVDAILPEDLAVIAEAAADMPFLTGNSSVAEYLPAAWRRRGWLAEGAAGDALPAIDGPGVVLAGSCAERTIEQLAAFEAAGHPVLRLALSPADNADTVAERAARWVLAQPVPSAVATSAGPDEVARLQSALGREGASQLAETILSGIARRVAAGGVRRILVAGGESSGVVVETLGLKRLAVGAFTVPGMGRAVSTEPALSLVLKSGKLGDVGMFVEALDAMGGDGTATSGTTREALTDAH
ncbi:serine kinase [Acuticoccus sediminis]|uniref:3-oxo-tetronate kinase n=1 Tax=Acuticoccus sediminis TaxID=2184697 RepID=A0A8B2NUG4_9HYPH|nr:3-oxo-tetronate kinase [Acuticoccus sediminis]RAI00813.1 serine kinase [Acuticoccus sediminis]